MVEVWLVLMDQLSSVFCWEVVKIDEFGNQTLMGFFQLNPFVIS